jgi:lipopolysaccharide transport system ATP-binding protein
MSNIAIKVENLSKIYRLGEIGTGTISRDMERWFKTKVLKEEDPFLKIGETNDRANKGKSDIVYSLKDINFEIQQGDAVGIIGRNGAGKSTLLKILSRVTTPTTGRINIKGRVASLLEVGTGFHPELTGRENIYLNGAILGMRKREIDRKLDEIIDFSGVERYIDTPVKRYSSGMYVRLAFAVAAHLESEILIVDEVLAVGDAEFQKKCLGKMGEVSKGEGRTVLFVSHNMTSIANLCNNLIVMDAGSLGFQGLIADGISNYLSQNLILTETKNYLLPFDDSDIRLDKFDISQKGRSLSSFITSEDLDVSITYTTKRNMLDLRIGFDLRDDDTGAIIFRSFNDDSGSIQYQGNEVILSTAKLPGNLFKPGNYSVVLAAGIHNVRWITHEEISISFCLTNIDGINKNYADNRPGYIMPRIEWDQKINN